MKNIYKVNDECIACRACVEVAPKNFDIADDGLAFVYKQPENAQETANSDEAVEICPVNAISKKVVDNLLDNINSPIFANSNIKETLDKHPELKSVLVNYSDKFKKLLNPIMYNTVAKFATFNDAARVTKLSICEILHTLNDYLGTTQELLRIAPDCILTNQIETLVGETISWVESNERYIYNINTMPEIVQKISELKPQKNIVLISTESPDEIINICKGLNFKFNIEHNREYRVSIFNPNNDNITDDWQSRMEDFELLDVRTMKTDPFDIIIQKAYQLQEGQGFKLIQRFEPIPIMNMLSEMGYEYVSKKIAQNEYHVYFHKTPVFEDSVDTSNKAELVIQSATPVAYPVIMRLLQSDIIRKSVKIKELKVWEETEKHLAWINNGKADISFSALITSVKLQKIDIKIPAIFVWDNFVLLTRYPIKSLEDIKGRVIHTPLFEEAPPTKITKYLIKALGMNPDEFTFSYGKPFGRPEEIFNEFVTGKADTVILREPEASYAIKSLRDRKLPFSAINYNEIWNEVNPGFGSFPNAGVVFKGEFVRQNPELAKVFLDELKKAIEWVNTNKDDSANLSFDMMRQTPDKVRLFLDRVNFTYSEGPELVRKVKSYFDVLSEQNIIDTKIEDSFYSIFEL